MTNRFDKGLPIHCQKHPRYRALRKPKTRCKTCHLMYVIRYQNSGRADRYLGGLDPYQFIVSGYDELHEACSELKVAQA